MLGFYQPKKVGVEISILMYMYKSLVLTVKQIYLKKMFKKCPFDGQNVSSLLSPTSTLLFLLTFNRLLKLNNIAMTFTKNSPTDLLKEVNLLLSQINDDFFFY